MPPPWPSRLNWYKHLNLSAIRTNPNLAVNWAIVKDWSEQARYSMSISEIGSLYPTVSNSTISTTITKLWKDKKLVDKRILPENQRVTTVSLTEKGQKVLAEIKRTQSEVFSTVTVSLGLTPDQVGYFQDILENAIGFFDKFQAHLKTGRYYLLHHERSEYGEYLQVCRRCQIRDLIYPVGTGCHPGCVVF